MNLVKTLAKVAMGVMVARGVGKMLGNKGGSTSTSGGGLLGGRPPSSGLPGNTGGGLGGPDGVGGLSGGNRSSSGNLNIPRNTSQSGAASGGLGGLLEGLTKGGLGQQSGGQSTGSSGRGLADILGSVLGGATAGKGGGGLGDLLESLGGGARSSTRSQPTQPSVNQGSCEQPQQPASTGSLGDLLNQAFGGKVAEPKPDQNAQAEIMLRGMLNAAKSDGKFDQNEQQKVMEHLGDISQEERAFVQNEMSKPLDVDAFVKSIPRGLEQQVYVMSLLGIELDSQAEAQYLDKLARGLGIQPQQANGIHQQIGVPQLYG